MENKIPKTKEECFAQLDAMLSDEDKNELKNSEDVIRFHFSLGMWIRNNWIYPLSEEERDTFMMMFADDEKSEFGFYFSHPDMTSSDIIEKYVEYLKNKN